MVSFADWKHHLPGFLVSFLLLYSCCPFCSVAAAAASAVPPNEPFFTATVWLYASTSLPKRCGNTKIFIHPPKSQAPPEPLYLSKDEAGSSPHMHLHSRGQGRQGWSGKTMHSRQTWHEQNRSASPKCGLLQALLYGLNRAKKRGEKEQFGSRFLRKHWRLSPRCLRLQPDIHLAMGPGNILVFGWIDLLRRRFNLLKPISNEIWEVFCSVVWKLEWLLIRNYSITWTVFGCSSHIILFLKMVAPVFGLAEI